MVTLLNRISISDDLSHQLYLGLNPLVEFVYLHKNGRETTISMHLVDAVFLAEKRRDDKRYKNFEFCIL